MSYFSQEQLDQMREEEKLDLAEYQKHLKGEDFDVVRALTFHLSVYEAHEQNRLDTELVRIAMDELTQLRMQARRLNRHIDHLHRDLSLGEGL